MGRSYGRDKLKEQIMEKMNFGKFMQDHDFVLCNKVVDFMQSGDCDYDYFYRPERFAESRGALGGDGEIIEDYLNETIYQWFLTNFTDHDVEYYHKHYGLRFVFVEKLGLWVFANDICFGMSFGDVDLEMMD